MGRAHRHKDDYGAVVVIDSRLESDYSEFFPPWIKRELTEYKSMNKLFYDIGHFFKDMAYK
jgi:Rad3-related DNA helicase